MKYLLLCFLVITLTSYSQSEITSLGFGDATHFEDVSIEFVELISDSRCPKAVSCIRAGEAKVLVAIYKGGKFSHEKILVFHANGLVNEGNMQLFNSEYLNIQGLALHSYPKGLGKIIDENYYLDLRIN